MISIIYALILAVGVIIIDELTTFFGLRYNFEKTGDLKEALELEVNPKIKALYLKNGLETIQIHWTKIPVYLIFFGIWEFGLASIAGLPTVALFYGFGVGVGINNIIRTISSGTEDPNFKIAKIFAFNMFLSFVIYSFTSDPYSFCVVVFPFVLSLWFEFIAPHFSKPPASKTS